MTATQKKILIFFGCVGNIDEQFSVFVRWNEISAIYILWKRKRKKEWICVNMCDDLALDPPNLLTWNLVERFLGHVTIEWETPLSPINTS